MMYEQYENLLQSCATIASISVIQSKNMYIRGDIKLVCHIAKIKIEADEFETTCIERERLLE